MSSKSSKKPVNDIILTPPAPTTFSSLLVAFQGNRHLPQGTVLGDARQRNVLGDPPQRADGEGALGIGQGSGEVREQCEPT